MTGSRTLHARRWGSRRPSRSAASGRRGGRTTTAVCASYCAEMTSVGMLLSVTSRMARSTGGTFHTSQFERMNWRLGAFLWIERRKGRERALLLRPRRSLALIGNPLTARDAVEESVAEDADARGIEPRSSPGGREARRVAVIEGVDGGGNLRRRVRPRRHGPLQEHAAADHHVSPARQRRARSPSRSADSPRSAARAAGTSRRCRRSARGSEAARCRRGIPRRSPRPRSSMPTPRRPGGGGKIPSMPTERMPSGWSRM